MAVFIRCAGFADGTHYAEGQYLKMYDPEAFAGQGDVEWTNDAELAIKFPSLQEAFDCYRTVPRNRPYRPDGELNRPLMAFNIVIEPVEGKKVFLP